MTPGEFDSIESDLRSAIISRCYAQARLLAISYTKAAAQRLNSLRPGPERRAFLVHTRSTFQWATKMAISDRAHLARSLESSPRPHPLFRPEPLAPRFDIEG